MIESYFHTGRKVNNERSYSVCKKLQFPQVVVDYKQFQECLDCCVSLFLSADWKHDKRKS
jgi:hypothetical protein